MRKESKTDQALQTGDRISWEYTHAIGRNRMTRYKHGTFIRHGKKYAVVALDGNGAYSNKPYNELTKLTGVESKTFKEIQNEKV